MTTGTEPFEIRFVPDNRSCTSEGPVELFLAAAMCGIVVEQPCGSRGTCGKCRIRLVAGEIPPAGADRRLLSEGELDAGWRLACQLVVDRPVTIEVPPGTRSLAGKSFGGDLEVDADRVPVVDVRDVQGGAASLEVQQTDLDRLTAALGLPRHSLTASPRVLAPLQRVLAVSGSARVAVQNGELVAVSDVHSRWPLGLALDIGSTSLAAALIDLRDGRVLCADSRLNPQVAFGADIISRIHFATERADGLDQLTDAVRDGLADLIRDLLAAARCGASDVILAACAGNPTMMHAWAGVAIAPLGTAPYLGVWSSELHARAAEFGLPIHPNAPVYIFPMVRSHVGADAVSAAVATGLDRRDRPALLIDLGTNTEIMLAAGGRLLATSAAAGPAFEGGSIAHGMRAAPGAIDAVRVTSGGRVHHTTIGNQPARGVCGSGLIDAVAELLRAGAISVDGFLRPPEHLPGSRSGSLADHFVTVAGQNGFVLARRAEAAHDRDIVLMARDVRQLQLVKGSILAATAIICREAGLDPGELDEVLIAGAFGNYIRKASALAIGLVPSLDPERVRFVGNAAGLGARMALCDDRVRARARSLAARAEYVELATHGDYQALFMDALAFPAAATPVGLAGPSGTRGSERTPAVTG